MFFHRFSGSFLSIFTHTKNGEFTDFLMSVKSSVFNFHQLSLNLYSAESEASSEELLSSVFAASSVS